MVPRPAGGSRPRQWSVVPRRPAGGRDGGGRWTRARRRLPSRRTPPPGQPMAVASDPAPAPPELTGPQPVDAFIRRALAENRTVQAAYHNVQSLKHRIPQVTALDDPVASNTIFPIPSVAPQYSLMGYNPYNLTLAQQFPWFGTLRLRGEVAERDVQVALAELAAAQLDAVAAVKRAYYDLYASQRTEEILAENRKILEDFRAIARAAARDRRHPAGRDPVRGADQRARPRAGEQPAGDRLGPRGPGPPDPRQPRGRPPDAPRAAARGRPGRDRAALPAGHRRPPRAAGAAWPPSPATRRPSSWPASGSTPTSRSA